MKETDFRSFVISLFFHLACKSVFWECKKARPVVSNPIKKTTELRESLSFIYVQLVKQNSMHACRLAVSVVRYVYAFGTIIPSVCGSPVCHQVLRDVT